MRKEIIFEQNAYVKRVTKKYIDVFELSLYTIERTGIFTYNIHLSAPSREDVGIAMEESIKNDILLHGVKHLWNDKFYRCCSIYMKQTVNEYADLIDSHLCDFNEEKRWILTNSIWKTVTISQ